MYSKRYNLRDHTYHHHLNLHRLLLFHVTILLYYYSSRIAIPLNSQSFRRYLRLNSLNQHHCSFLYQKIDVLLRHVNLKAILYELQDLFLQNLRDKLNYNKQLHIRLLKKLLCKLLVLGMFFHNDLPFFVSIPIYHHLYHIL